MPYEIEKIILYAKNMNPRKNINFNNVICN